MSATFAIMTSNTVCLMYFVSATYLVAPCSICDPLCGHWEVRRDSDERIISPSTSVYKGDRSGSLAMHAGAGINCISPAVLYVQHVDPNIATCNDLVTTKI